jgi:hypothetical protein
MTLTRKFTSRKIFVRLYRQYKNSPYFVKAYTSGIFYCLDVLQH